jgi:GT2 family glycosyltransferase
VTPAVDPRVSVVIPCHTGRRWPLLVRAVESVLAQSPRPARVVVAVDHNPDLLRWARAELSGVAVVPNRFARGVGGTRNTGIAHTDTPIIALLDDDARARPGWLAALLAPLEDAGVIGTGGRAVPDWQRPRPRWFPDEFLWAVGASFTDAPTAPTPARNVWSLSMAMRRELFDAAGGFEAEFSKVGARSRPEDTDLCLRMSRINGGRWIHTPDAVVDHLVPTDRATLKYLLTRCYAEGRGKFALARRHRGGAGLDLEWRYLRRALPAAVVRGVADTVRGRDRWGVPRAGVVIAGAAAAALGCAAETVLSVAGDRADHPGSAAPEHLPPTAPEAVAALWTEVSSGTDR